MSNFLPLLADRIWNRPLLIDPGKAEVIFAVLEGRILPTLGQDGEGAASAQLEGLTSHPEASRFKGSIKRAQRNGTYIRASGSTAIITVDGSLVNRGAWIGASSGLTSYEGIAAQLDDAHADRDIKSIIIDMNSFGGEATGMFALAAKVRKVAESKRVIAVVNDVAASAGYGIISGAHEIVVSETSMVGSIGVVMMHIDRSGEMQMKGLRPSFIHSGARKVDGHPFAALSDDVRAGLQANCDTLYARFLETVALGRGDARLSAEKARATEAGIEFGQAAIAAGFADRIGTFDEVLAELNRSLSGKSKQERSGMDANSDTKGGISLDAHNAAVTNARSEGNAAGRIEGAAAEKTRIKSIMTSEAAKGRETSARTFALDTDMSIDDAMKILATTPMGDQPHLTIEQRVSGQSGVGGSLLPDPLFKPTASKSKAMSDAIGHAAGL